jgi:hypothetical protein
MQRRAHRSQIHDRGYSGKILQDYARGLESYFGRAGGLRTPRQKLVYVVVGDFEAVIVTKRAFEKNSYGIRQPVDFPRAVFVKRREMKDCCVAGLRHYFFSMRLGIEFQLKPPEMDIIIEKLLTVDYHMPLDFKRRV